MISPIHRRPPFLYLIYFLNLLYLASPNCIQIHMKSFSPLPRIMD